MTDSEMAETEKPIDELIRLAGEEWADLDAAAFLLSEAKTSEFSRLVNEYITENGSMPFNRAEAHIKGSPEWRAHLEAIAEARRKANAARVYYDSLRTRFKVWETANANRRSERYATSQ